MASDEKKAQMKDTSKHDDNWGKCHYQFDNDFVKQTAKTHEKWFLEHVNPAIAPVLQATEVYRVLAVGSGTGYADRAILQCIQQLLKENNIEQKKIQYTVVEPDGKAVEVCKTILGEIAKEMNLEFTWEVTSLGNYLSRQEKGQFELIHFIHSLCGFSHSENRLPLFVNDLLTPSGTLAIVLGGNNNFWVKIANKFRGRLNLHDESDKKNSHHGHMVENHKESEDRQLEDPHHRHSNHDHDHHEHGHEHKINKEVLQVIKTNKWKHKNFASSEKIHVTEALVSGSDSFFKLLGHMFNVEAAKVRVCDPQVLDEVLDYLKEETGRDVIDGKEIRYFVTDQDIFIVYKD